MNTLKVRLFQVIYNEKIVIIIEIVINQFNYIVHHNDYRLKNMISNVIFLILLLKMKIVLNQI